MARRAVQGYTEKSYFDNTRFLGLLATSDPLQEGYFRHLVNLDISDTGQSVKPRSGYLTTSLCTTGYVQVSLSDKTVVYKDERIQEHVLYDFTNQKGYVADLSADNLHDKMIPYTREVGHYYWSNVVQFLLKESAAARNLYTNMLSQAIALLTLHDGATYKLVAKTSDDYQGIDPELCWDCTYLALPNPYTMADIWTRFAHQYGTAYSSWADAYPDEGMLKVKLFDNSYAYYQIALIMLDAFESAIKTSLTVVPNDPMSIYDIYHVHKRLIPATYGTLDFWLEIYYREEASTIDGISYTGNSLIFEALDFHQHPTYDAANRNIANDDDLLPVTMQMLYTSETRPDGNTSTLNPYVFVKDDGGSYFMTYIYPTNNHTIIPHFYLNPAYMEITGNINDVASCFWAYRFDVTTTKVIASSDIAKSDTVFRSQWMKYQGPTVAPIPVFDNTTLTNYDFTNADLEQRHHKGARYMIYVVPKTVVSTTSSTLAIQGGGAFVPQSASPNLSTAQTLYNSWMNTLSTIIDLVVYDSVTDIASLREAITSLSATALFYIKDLHDANQYVDHALSGFFTFESSNGILENYCISPDTSSGTYASRFVTGETLLKQIQADIDFIEDSITFKLLPFCSTDTVYDNANPAVYRYTNYLFASLNQWSTGYALFKYGYNNNQYRSALTFSILANGTYTVGVTTDTLRAIPGLKDLGFFNNGYLVTFYLYPYMDTDLANKTHAELHAMQVAWDASTPFVTTRSLLYGYDALTVTEVILEQPDDPAKIQAAEGSMVFDNSRLVLWHGADVYVSEANDYYYFKEDSHKTFGEKIIKVIQFKEILLVFTVQHLYAMYEMDIQTATGKLNSDGTPIMSVRTMWLSQTVLYNIQTSARYADAIQVFNQMVLFYSEDGQMFLIKPNTQIDDQTRFSLQYFNKSVNDILANYEAYMNERLVQYGVDKILTKEDVSIKVDVSVNFINIYYDAPGYITYLLRYDVLNNRYTVYDTLSFHDIRRLLYTPSGLFIINEYIDKIYFTFPYTEALTQDSLGDMAIHNDFLKVPVASLLDTGDMSLNNHLTKRFRDLHVVFKNLDAKELMLRIETELDDVVHVPFYSTQLEVKDINGQPTYTTVTSASEVNLLDFVDNERVAGDEINAFSQTLKQNVSSQQAFVIGVANYTSNKLITYRTSILGVGKVFRLKLQFISKGSYKIQQFGIIYKERRI